MQFCLRIICLEYVLPTNARNDFVVSTDHTPLSVFKQFHRQWLVEGEPTPFNYMHQLKNYGMNIAKNSKGEDKIRFSANGKVCYYKNSQFKISAWKTMVKDILRKAESILSRQLLFQTSNTIATINPYDIVDDESVSDVGHFFGEMIDDYGHVARSTVIENLRESGLFESATTMDENAIMWKKEWIRKYVKIQEEFMELCLMAMNFTCGQTGRGTEMLSIVYKNIAAADRNVILLDGQIMISTEYHKSQSITDDIKVCN
jgi:hypothetical protein